ncbi:MAG TPA: GAF domain-containing sensor histidine kinase [Polyangia bacterium]
MGASLHASTAALIHLNALPGEGWEEALREILRVDSNILGVECVSYWRFRVPSSIVCELGYHQSIRAFDRGLELRSSDSPGYFQAIRETPILAIQDARRDERMHDVRAYLQSRQIGALLDTAIRVNGQPVGILCHEHVGGPRRWSEQEQQIAFAMGQTVATRVAARAHSLSDERERRAALLADVMTEVAEVFGSSAAAQVAVDRAVPTLGDFCVLVGVEGPKASNVAAAHIQPEGLALVQRIMTRHPPSLTGPGFASHVIREQESLLVPDVDDRAARYYGIEGDYLDDIVALGVRSAMAAPFSVRGVIRGAMAFGSSFLRYDENDLKFAEAYAQRVGLILENGRLYRRAEEAVAARDEFLSLASHELRTPLTSIGLLAQLIVREASALPVRSLASLGQGMVRQAGRLDRLADRLLSASEIGSHLPTIRRERVDLSELVRDLTLAFSSAAAAVGSTLTAHADADVIGYVDPARIEQVIGNLIDNAVKFGMGNPIEVELHADDGAATISVRDHGPGMPLEEQAEIFKRYQRGSGAAGLGGLGLGLHVVRELVQSHGGTVRVDARPGKGSTFMVTLPLASDCVATEQHR